MSAPSRPTGLAVAASPEKLYVTWTASPSVPGVFKLYRKIGTGSYAVSPIYTGFSPSYVDTGLTAGTVYTYKVTVTVGPDTSGYSLEASGVPTPDLSSDSYSGGTKQIAPEMHSRWIRLADPGEKVQMHRVIPSFRWAGADCPIEFSLTQIDGTDLIPWTVLDAPTSDGDLHRPVIECFAEAEAVRVNYRIPDDNDTAFTRLEIYDTIIEYVEARQRQPNP